MASTLEEKRLFALTEIERTFWEQGNHIVLGGMDEVGRGPLAGPVVAACVIMPSAPLVEFVNDSKRLTNKRRAAVYELLKKHALSCALGWVEPKEIDECNILNATKAAFRKAFASIALPITDVLVDAMKDLNLPAREHVYIKGDQKSYLIAAASIIAKVERDRYMIDMDREYPQYGFAKNKGYGTKAHIEALIRYGPCPLHRRSFIKKFVV